MADTAVLSHAHDHARLAARHLAESHREEAADQHRAAARDFSRATKFTSNTEALRVLRLLEKEHENLATILSAKDDELAAVTSYKPQIVDESTPVKNEPAIPQLTVSTQASPAIRDKVSTRDRTRLSTPVRSASPSLARDMASRRGIPPPAGLPVSPNARRQLSPESQRTPANVLPRIPPSVMDSQSQLQRQDPKPDDDGFASFYNNLTTGTMSKLSSVLAYAGLPLTEGEKEETIKSSRRTVKANAEPDVKKIFSRAALDAIEDDHRRRGLQGHVFGPSESFYVVQTAGGTLSYADIAKASTHTSPIGGDDEEAFVDAQEAQPPSPRQARTTVFKNERGKYSSGRTGEELELENSTLKQTLEQLSHRLANFEAHAQDASMAAVTQSVANLRAPNSDAGSQERITLLEKQIEQQTEQRQKMEDLVKKQEKKIRAYHSKWEEIKKNAREKEKVKKERQNGVDEDDMPIIT